MKELLAQLIDWLNNLLNKLKGVEKKMTEEKQNHSNASSKKDKSDNGETNEQQKPTKEKEDTEQDTSVDNPETDSDSTNDKSKVDKYTKKVKNEIEETSQEVAAAKVDDINRVKLEEDLDNSIKEISTKINDLVNKVDEISNKEKFIINNDFGKLEKGFRKLEELEEFLISVDDKSKDIKKKIEDIHNTNKKAKSDITNSNEKVNNQISKLMEKLRNINEDINNNNTDLEEKINKTEENINGKLKKINVPNKQINKIHNETKKVDSKFKKLSDELNNLEKLIEKLSFKDEIKGELEPISKKIERAKEVVIEQLEEIMLGKLTPQANDLDEIKKTVEVLEGKLNTLDDIKETLADEGVSIEQELAPVNEEDEVIKELADYGKEIFDHLTTAARHYAQKREDINNLAQIRENHDKKLKETKKKFYEKGEQDAKNKIIKDLVDGFNDLDQLFDGEDGIGRTLVSFLKNNGLKRDEELRQRKIIEITEQERTEFEARASFKGSGKFKVKKSCFRLADDIINRADLEELKEEAEGDDIPEEDNPSDNTNESNENKVDIQGKVNNSSEANQKYDKEVNPNNNQNE